MNKERLITLSLMIFAAAASRLVPHPYNFTPVAAMALFAGATFERKWSAFAIPLLALLLSDAVLGFYGLKEMLVTYFGFAAIVCIGFLVRGRPQVMPIALATLSGAVTFFLITNCAFLINTSLYPQTLDGLVQGYVAGVPFFRNTLLSDIFYSTLLFGGFLLAEHKYAWLKVSRLAA
jgi:hypothetical protein